MKLDIKRIEDLLKLGHMQIAVALLTQTRKAIQAGKPLILQTISETDDTAPHGTLHTVEQFDLWLKQTPILVQHSLYEKVIHNLPQ